MKISALKAVESVVRENVVILVRGRVWKGIIARLIGIWMKTCALRKIGAYGGVVNAYTNSASLTIICWLIVSESHAHFWSIYHKKECRTERSISVERCYKPPEYGEVASS